MEKIIAALEILSKKWSSNVDTKWEPPEGLFTKPASEIAKVLKANSKDLSQAMSRLNFYINRAGSNLSPKDKKRLDKAVKELHNLY